MSLDSLLLLFLHIYLVQSEQQFDLTTSRGETSAQGVAQLVKEV
jgi:hypothetical protein